MVHLLKTSYKWKLRSFVCIFWPMVFPLILGTCFHFGLGNIGKAETLQTVSVALISENPEGTPSYFSDYLSMLTEGEPPVLSIQNFTEAQALEALDSGEIAGIFHDSREPSLQVSESGMEATILEGILRMYTDRAQVAEAVIREHPEKAQSVLFQLVPEGSFLEEVSLGGKSLSFTAQFFYALIAMASLYGGYIGITAVGKMQADASALGARCSITPTHKFHRILAELITSFTLHLVNLTVLLLVIKYLYRVPMGGSFPMMLLIAAMGDLIGVSMGIFIGAAVKGNEGLKVGLVTGISMIGSFCAGLMSQSVKSSIDRNLPFINRINPAAVIADSLYCINIYDDAARMALNLGILLAMSLILVTASFLVIRRERYASI